MGGWGEWDSPDPRTYCDLLGVVASIKSLLLEHGSKYHSATRWLASNCSIHCACIAVWPKANETELGAALITKNGYGRTLTLTLTLT